MADYTVVNLKRDVEDQAARFGYAPNVEARFARDTMELHNSGLSYFRVAPNFRMPFGHRHKRQEEVYVILSGSARLKVDDEIVELNEWDAVRLPPERMRNLEGGPEGAEVLAFSAPKTGPLAEDVEMAPNWWSD